MPACNEQSVERQKGYFSTDIGPSFDNKRKRIEILLKNLKEENNIKLINFFIIFVFVIFNYL